VEPKTAERWRSLVYCTSRLASLCACGNGVRCTGIYLVTYFLLPKMGEENFSRVSGQRNEAVTCCKMWTAPYVRIMNNSPSSYKSYCCNLQDELDIVFGCRSSNAFDSQMIFPACALESQLQPCFSNSETIGLVENIDLGTIAFIQFLPSSGTSFK